MSQTPGAPALSAADIITVFAICVYRAIHPLTIVLNCALLFWTVATMANNITGHEGLYGAITAGEFIVTICVYLLSALIGATTTLFVLLLRS